MSFKFSLLNLEKTDDCEESENNYKMPKTKKSKQTAHQKRFGKSVKKCHSKTKTPRKFGDCMRKELKK